jgi:hypothetical protein
MLSLHQTTASTTAANSTPTNGLLIGCGGLVVEITKTEGETIYIIIYLL